MSKVTKSEVVPSQPELTSQELIASEVQVRLSKAEEATIQKLRPAFQADARKDLLDRKTADRIAYLNDPKTKARLDRDEANRTVFGCEHYESGTMGVRGLGRKFPVVLYKGEWQTLIANIEAIKAAVAVMKDEEQE